MLRSGVPNSVGTATQLGVLKKDLDLAQLLFDPVAGSACVRAWSLISQLMKDFIPSNISPKQD